MNKYKIVAAAIVFASAWCSVPVLQAQQDDSLSTYEKCRLVTAADLKDKKAPKFSAYRANSSETVEKPKLDLKSNPTARMYRTVLRHEVVLGPNFAGHYRVAVWGCGTSCAMFAIVNLKTGRVITPSGFSSTSAVDFEVESWDVLPHSQHDDGLFGFRKDSRLLLVLGDLDEDESREGAFYLVLNNERLRLIHSTLVAKDCDKLRGQR